MKNIIYVICGVGILSILGAVGYSFEKERVRKAYDKGYRKGLADGKLEAYLTIATYNSTEPPIENEAKT